MSSVATEETSSIASEDIAAGEMSKKWIVRGLNGLAMDRHGLILWENEATHHRMVFKCLRGLRDVRQGCISFYFLIVP